MGGVDECNEEVVLADKMPSELQVGGDMALCWVRYHYGVKQGPRRCSLKKW